MSNFDIANLALKSVCPSNEMLCDDKGMPSVMCKIPKMTWAELGLGDSTEVFPAFKVHGQEIDALYISKYQNIKNNSRGYSLPGEDPGTAITLAGAQTHSTNKGDGWHCITRLEWMAIALWCLKNGHLPKGNNNYGKDHTETLYKAIPTYYSDGKICRVATGTGPLSWSHNGEADGIWDLNGNVYEWTAGVRTVFGELQVMTSDGVTFDNACADPECVDSSTSTLWRAIDGTTGELIVPNGTGTTANSLKADWVNSKWKWITGTQTGKDGTYHRCPIESIEVDTNVCEAAILKLQALGFYKSVETSGVYQGDYVYMDINAEERSFYCGGGWYYSSHAGVFFASGCDSRSHSGTSIGFRSAFVELPTE